MVQRKKQLRQLEGPEFSLEENNEYRSNRIRECKLIPFRRGGRSYEFPYRQSQLLNCLREGRARSVTEVINCIWSGDINRYPLDKLENRLHQLQLATNKALKATNLLTYKIICPVPNHLQLSKT